MATTTDDRTPARCPVALGVRLWRASPALLIGALGALLWVSSYQITGRDAYYPRTLSILVLALALWNVLRDMLEKSALVDQEVDVEGGHGHGVHVWRTATMLIILLAFVPLVHALGFLVAAGAMVVAVPLALGVRSPGSVAAYAALVVGALYLVFVQALGVSLETGWWS